MRRSWLSLSLVLIAWAAPASPALEEAAREETRNALYRRFQPSKIEIQKRGYEGTVRQQGRLVILSVGGVPAKPFRVGQANPGSPRYHVMDFAWVEIAPDGTFKANPDSLTLDRGTHLVVLDVTLKGDSVHLLTHTADPLPGPPDAEPTYGCTELVFRLEPGLLRAGAAEPIILAIERWLEWTPVERICAGGVNQLCIEP